MRPRMESSFTIKSIWAGALVAIGRTLCYVAYEGNGCKIRQIPFICLLTARQD